MRINIDWLLAARPTTWKEEPSFRSQTIPNIFLFQVVAQNSRALTGQFNGAT